MRGLIRRLFSRARTGGTTLTASTEGLVIAPLKGEPSSLMVRWSDVVSVTVFKRDRYIVDDICMMFELRDGTSMEVNEEMPGWKGLIEGLPTYLPGAVAWTEWFARVAFPAFKNNPTVVFSRRAG